MAKNLYWNQGRPSLAPLSGERLQKYGGTDLKGLRDRADSLGPSVRLGLETMLRNPQHVSTNQNLVFDDSGTGLIGGTFRGAHAIGVDGWPAKRGKLTLNGNYLSEEAEAAGLTRQNLQDETLFHELTHAGQFMATPAANIHPMFDKFEQSAYLNTLKPEEYEKRGSLPGSVPRHTALALMGYTPAMTKDYFMDMEQTRKVMQYTDNNARAILKHEYGVDLPYKPNFLRDYKPGQSETSYNRQQEKINDSNVALEVNGKKK